jgi:hypothetical protein
MIPVFLVLTPFVWYLAPADKVAPLLLLLILVFLLTKDVVDDD